MPQPKLDEIAAALSANPQISSVNIIGYTDRIGSNAYNLKLSQRRANAVKAYLVSKGISANRLNAVGKGKSDPVVQCTQRNRAAMIQCLEPNRRVVVQQIKVERRVSEPTSALVHDNRLRFPRVDCYEAPMGSLRNPTPST